VWSPPCSERDSLGFRRRGWIGAVLLGPAAAIALLSYPIAGEGTSLESLLDGLGWLLLAAGVGLRIWATLYVGGRKKRAVVMQGPYSVCRNPLYLGSLLITSATALFLQSPVFAAAVVLAAVLYASTTVPAEETYLRAALGDEYLRYCERVPRFWPRFSGFRAESPIVVHLSGLRREMLRVVHWLALPVVAEMLIRFRLRPWWPHLRICGASVCRWLR
jgi:protein-S-isoprenylcysteine O-methyltransferase Ste14